jgi:hypothetical protein
MSPQRRLMIASILFAVIWTALMIWWNAPTFAGAVILVIGGALAGILWFFGMRWWLNKVAPNRQ